MKRITNRKIRYAIVGCGRISKNHFGSVEKHADNIELIVICDNNARTLAEHSSKYKVPGYTRFKDMLDNEHIDLVAFCTPSGIHSNQTITATKHDMHVMMEKPMTTRWQDGLRMVEECDEVGMYLFVIKQNRCNATLQLLKRAIEEKRFGKIHMVHLNVFWTRPQEYYDQAKWRGTWEFDGGAFMN